MTIQDINEVYSLFMDGFVVGGLLSAIPFMIGCAIRGVLRLIQNS